MDSGNLAAFLNHALCVNGGSLNLAADRSVHDVGDFLDDFGKVPSLFCNQGWIGGYAADDTHIIGLFDVLNISCVHKKFHSKYPPKMRGTGSPARFLFISKCIIAHIHAVSSKLLQKYALICDFC